MEPQLPQVCHLVDLSIEIMFICEHVCPVHSCNGMVYSRSFWYDNWHNHSSQLPCYPNQLLISIYIFFALLIGINTPINTYPSAKKLCVE
jgi:hypothetical protein